MMRLHHIGVACRDISGEIAAISRLHEVMECTGILFDKAQNADLALLTLKDGTRIELIGGPAVDTLLKRNITYYHLCFEVADIDSEIDRLTKEGAKLLSPPTPAVLFGGRKVAFLHVSYGIIELLSQNDG